MAFKILAAYTNLSTLKAIHLTFHATDYDIYTSHDGIEALELFQQMSPDVAVFGLSLPRKSGYELAGLLRKGPQPSQVPLVLLLDAFDILDEEKVKGLGHITIVSKPFDSEDLAQKIRNLAGETRDPETLPEEPELSSHVTLPVPDAAALEARLEDKIKKLVKEEILAVERELEKRVTTHLKISHDTTSDLEVSGDQKPGKHN